jgi:hypothetical protein
MRTAVRTFRLAHAVCDQIDKEAERRKTTSADVVRLAISEFFQRKQVESALLGIEQRLTARVDLNARMLADGIKEILDLATPESVGSK